MTQNYDITATTSGVSVTIYKYQRSAQIGSASVTFKYSPPPPLVVQVNTAVSPSNGGTASGAGTYDVQDTLRLEANPASGFEFDHWYVDKTGATINDNPYTTTVQPAMVAYSPITFTAYFNDIRPTYTITVGSGTGGSSSGGGSGHQGDTVNIYATPNSGYVFDYWTISGSGTINSRYSRNTYVTIGAGNGTVTPHFSPEVVYYSHYLYYQKNAPSGTTVSNMPSTQSQTTTSATSYTFTVSTMIPVCSGSYQFLGWSESSSATTPSFVGGNSISVNADSSRTLYAVWKPVFTATINVNDVSYGSVSQSTITNIPSGSSITVDGNKITINGTTVTATPSNMTTSACYYFIDWTNATGPITSNITITANFGTLAPTGVSLQQGGNYILTCKASGTQGIVGILVSSNTLYIATNSEYDIVDLGIQSRADGPVIMVITPDTVSSQASYNTDINQ